MLVDTLCEQVTLRECIGQLDMDAFIGDCVSRSRLDAELLKESAFSILIELLAKEPQEEFANIKAFWVYLRTATLRSAFRKVRKEQLHSPEGLEELVELDNPEETLLSALERSSLSELLSEVLKKHQAPRGKSKEIRELLEVLLGSEDYIQLRRSGEHKGGWVFDISGLARTLGWKRQRVYKRLELLQKAILKEAKKYGY